MVDKLLEQIIHNAPNYIFWKDTNLIYRGCNYNFARVAGLDNPEQIIGKCDNDLPWQQTGYLYQAEDQEILSSGQSILNKEVPMVLGAETRILSVSKVPLYGNDKKIIGILGIYIDITQKNALIADLEKSLRIKTEFLENMRHDIRTPLTGIIGFADLIKSGITDPKMKEYASNLAASGYALMDLLNEVLEAVKINSGEIPLLKKKFNLQKKLDEVISLNQARALYKKIDLSFQYDSAIPNYLIGDPTRVHRIVLELVTNALNFTHKGHVKLSAQLAKDNKSDVVIKIIVEDTGIGIPLEKQHEIYVQFKRLIPSYEGIYKGHGLGLFIAKQFVDDLQGEIYVKSQVDVGSKFIFIVKLKKALLDEELGSEDLIPSLTHSKFILPQKVKGEPIAEETTGSYKSHILVVEDSSIAARVVTSMLSQMDCTIDVAEKGKDAVDFAEHKQYDLIFMDIGLPDIDGYEVTKRIRLNELNKNHVPIIALTAHASEENKKHCIDIGMNAVLTKPLIQKKAEDILNSFIPYRRDRLNLKETSDSITKTTDYEELAIFNSESIKEQFGSKETAVEIINLFLEGLPQELQEIHTAYTRKDWSLAQKLTHKLKGGVSYCGAPRLKEACAQLENVIKNRESKRFENLYNQLLKAASLTEKTMRKELGL
jgi:two-component system, OmpR family, aerobic respiration control sensor histidine kinase ArcB